MARRLDPSRYEQLLAAAEGGDCDFEVAAGPWTRLIAAYGHARKGEYVAARALVAEATAGAGDAPASAYLVAGMILYVCRDHALSLEAFDRAAQAEPRLAARALNAKARRAGRLGWAPEARETFADLVARDPRQLRWRLESLRLAARAEDFEQALGHAEAALDLEPGLARVQMERAGMLAQLGRDASASAAAAEAAELEHGSMAYLLEAARVGLEVGDYALARRQFEAAADLDPDDVRPPVGLASLALFASDFAAARLAVASARAHAPEHPLVLRTEAALDVLEANYDAAIDKLARVLAARPDDGEAHTWLAEARLRLGDYEGAYRALHDATMKSNGFHLAAWILRPLATIPDDDDGDTALEPNRFREIVEGVAALVPGGRAELESANRARITAVLERALGALGGNRTPSSTVMVDGHLTRLSVRTSPRHASRRALQLIRSASPSRALAALDEVCARYPESSLPVCHRGELRLWLGDLPGARADLEAAIDIQPATRWAWIGLTGIETLEGRPEEALATSARGIALMNDTVGNSVYGYRADAEFALGRVDEALRDLDESVRLSKSRLGAWVSLVAVLDHRGEHGRAAQIFARLLEDAPGLLSDAARELGVVLWSGPEARVSPSQRRAVTDRALKLLGGNRSSTCITYRTSEGRLRLVPRPGGRRPHDTDDDDLAQVRSLLLTATGISGVAGAQEKPGPRRPASTEPVSPSVIEHFVARGYVAIRGAFRRDLATRWVADAARRLREDPARWVRGYDPDDPVRSLDAFDPDDPATWTWERLDLLGSRIMPLAEAAPEAWRVACALLGGGGRIDRGELSDHLVVNFHTRSRPDYTAPELGYASWHLDDPSPEERLASFQRGLIVFVILSDLPTASGAPFIAPESVALVARELARSPDGVDLRSRESTARLTAACVERVELTGEVGDVFLVHPFMLHSSSGNPSGRIRWMANPILTLSEPLRLDGVDPSPLERSILRSI